MAVIPATISYTILPKAMGKPTYRNFAVSRETYAVLGLIAFVVNNNTSATDTILCLYFHRNYLVLVL